MSDTPTFDCQANVWPLKNHRILVVDDEGTIRQDLRKILSPHEEEVDSDAWETEVLGNGSVTLRRPNFELSAARQITEALDIVKSAREAGRHYAVVFLDAGMLPGSEVPDAVWRLREIDPDLQIVICTGCMDRFFEERPEMAASPDHRHVLEVPFDPVKLPQFARALAEKKASLQASRNNLAELERLVKARTRELESANALLEREVRNHEATAVALQASKQRLTDFFENANIGLLQIAADGVILRTNKAQLDLFGCGTDECLGEHISRFYADPGVIADFLRRLLAGEAVHDFEARLRRADGVLKHVLMDANAHWEDGVMRHARCFMRDNTARKHAEAQVREQAALLDKVPDAIFVQDLENRVLYWNRGAERIYGWSAQSMLGREIHALLGGDLEKVAEARRTTFETGGWAGECVHCDASGRGLIVASNWTLVCDEQGQPKSILIIDTDITEKRHLEQKTLHAQRLETIGTLAGGIAHDLNNVLQPIAMAMDLFRTQLTDPKSQNMLNVVSQNTERAAALIKQVLSFSRSVEGERLLIHPSALVGEVASIVRNTFPENIVLRQVPAIESPSLLLGDSVQLSQALVHLCMNARDAMPDGGTLTIGVKNIHIDRHFAALHTDATEGDFIVITVADTGVGVSEEVREKIFLPFFTTKEPGKGAGVGLATTLTIVRSHGGFITLHSKENRGTTVRVFLPVVKKESKPSVGRPRASRDPSAVAAIAPAGRGECILVVDDEPSVLTVMRLALEKNGYRVVGATNGAEGLRAYEQHAAEVRLVITDMVMPVMDGPALIAALKGIDPTVKVIAMTGMSTKASIDTVKQLGVQRILAKPCTSKTILFALDEVLGS